MRWFDGETPMNTYYTYRNGFLDKIEIRPEETSYTPEAVQSLIRDMYGEPDSVKTGEDGVTVEGWADEIKATPHNGARRFGEGFWPSRKF